MGVGFDLCLYNELHTSSVISCFSFGLSVFPWSSGTGSLFLTCKYFKISALRSKMKQKALKECDEYAAKYAECATGKTISVVWQCRKQAKELNNCLHQ